MQYVKSINGRTEFFSGELITEDKRTVNPTHEQLIAAGWEVYNEPEPTDEEKVRQAIERKVAEIEEYSNSDAVNDLTYNNVHTWLTPDVRANYKVSLDAAELLGEEQITFAIAGQAVTAPLSAVKVMLAKIQRYADAAFLVETQHKIAVSQLTSVQDIENYAYTIGFPEKLAF